MSFKSFFCMLAQVRQENLLIARAPGGDRQHLDALTSETPTFPYTAKQSEEFIDLLQHGKGQFRLLHLTCPPVNWFLADYASSPYITTSVARLWATVGKFYASTTQGTSRDPSYCSKPSLLHPFRRRPLSPVLRSIDLGGSG